MNPQIYCPILLSSNNTGRVSPSKDVYKRQKEGYVKIMMIGEYGENMPVEVGASSTTYFADYFYTNVASNTGQRGVLFGGNANSGANAGFSCAYTNNAASYTAANIGSRLCFLPA